MTIENAGYHQGQGLYEDGLTRDQVIAMTCDDEYGRAVLQGYDDAAKDAADLESVK